MTYVAARSSIHIGMNEGFEKKKVSYTGLGSTTIADEGGRQLPTATLTGTEIAPVGNLTGNQGHFYVLRKPGRGGHKYFERYCLQIEIEQEQMPADNGTLGGDRMKHLRNQFEGIKVENIEAKSFSRMMYNNVGMKFGEGGNAVVEH